MFKKDDRTRLFGGAKADHKRFNYDLSTYFKDIKNYIDEMKTSIKNDIVIKNFVKMFTLICSKITQSDSSPILMES
jgi:hypothetical protein